MGQDHIIFDGIASPHHLGIFQTSNRVHQILLYIFWQTGRKALNVDFIGIPAFWF